MDRDKKSVIVSFQDAQYVASTRHIRIEGRDCPDLDPKKLLPNDPDGARAIGGIHNRHDPVLRMLLSCETIPSLENDTSCSHHANLDLFIWQVNRYFIFLLYFFVSIFSIYFEMFFRLFRLLFLFTLFWFLWLS